ncbi:MAG: alpha/beta fold hydrolase, partial [Clostridia bacterium]
MKKKTIIDGLEVSYIEEGEGSPVLLLHGWGCNGGHWNKVIEGLKDEHRVIAPDIPGFGESEEPPETWGTREFARFFEHFMKFLKVERPVIIGHSNGGRISIMLAADGLAGKVILTDAAGIKPHRPASYYAKVYSYKAMKKALSLLLCFVLLLSLCACGGKEEPEASAAVQTPTTAATTADAETPATDAPQS